MVSSFAPVAPSSPLPHAAIKHILSGSRQVHPLSRAVQMTLRATSSFSRDLRDSLVLVLQETFT